MNKILEEEAKKTYNSIVRMLYKNDYTCTEAISTALLEIKILMHECFRKTTVLLDVIIEIDKKLQSNKTVYENGYKKNVYAKGLLLKDVKSILTEIVNLYYLELKEDVTRWKLDENLKYNNTKKQNESILLEAERITGGDRKEQYGDVKKSFSSYREILKTTFNIELTEQEIVKVLMAIKLGREKFRHKRDNLVDLCGYSKLLQQLEELK